MPVYEYRCEECGKKTEYLQRVGEDSSGKKCPYCGKGVLKKAFSIFGTGGGGSSCGSAQGGFT